MKRRAKNKMIKADDKVELVKNEQEKFTNFEFLQAEVEVLKNNINEIVEILRHNDIERKETIEPNEFDLDDVFNKLGEDIKE